MFRCFRDRSKLERNEYFLANGASVLEQIIRSFNGDCNPIRSYSLEELNNAKLVEIHRERGYIMYQGIHQNRRIAVKVFGRLDIISKDDKLELVANEIAIASRMSNHMNVLKLLGSCLETELPILIYEFPENGNLVTRLFFSANNRPEDQLNWDQKLKIVIGIANAVTYLHRGLPKTFIFRDLKPGNIFLDQNLSPKLFDFQFSLPIPEGKTHVDGELIIGTLRGHIAPEAYRAKRYTEKSDVYGFGALLCEVVTGKGIIELRNLHHLQTTVSATSSRWNDGRFQLDIFVREALEEHCKCYLDDERIRVQVLEYSKLMTRCLQENPDDRPNMIEAEKALRRIKNL